MLPDILFLTVAAVVSGAQGWEGIEAIQADMDRRFEAMEKRFEAAQADIKDLYRALNLQTWKMLGAGGLLAALIKLLEML